MTRFSGSDTFAQLYIVPTQKNSIQLISYNLSSTDIFIWAKISVPDKYLAQKLRTGPKSLGQIKVTYPG